MSTASETEPWHRAEESLIETTLEAFRLHRTFKQVLEKLEVKEAQRYSGRAEYVLSRIKRNLEDAGMSLHSVEEGERYDPGMAVTVLNIEEFDLDADRLVIDQMLEPIILDPQGVRRVGTVLLREVP